jgi:D-glycero-alpha-D-manno-heptose-7-phosphate kinase
VSRSIHHAILSQPPPLVGLDFQSLRPIGIESSAPGRIDCCASWDLKSFALLFESLAPAAVNMAVDLRTRVRLSGFSPGWACIESPTARVVSRADSLPIAGPLALPSAILSHFGMGGIRLEIASQIPSGSGLGGSGALAIATIGAIAKAAQLLKKCRFPEKGVIAHLASELETHLNVGVTGLQDQLAALYGGINRWTWKYSRPSQAYRRFSLVNQYSYYEVERRIALAFSGEIRESSEISRKDIDGLLLGSTRSQWIALLAEIKRFASAVRGKAWREAVYTLEAFASIRDQIGPNLWPPVSARFRDAARQLKCAACTCGANWGGCVWALGSPDRILELRRAWRGLADENSGARLLRAKIAREGLLLKVVRLNEREEWPMS